MYSNAAPAAQKEGLVLLSGGADSAVCLALAKRVFERVHTLSFFYDQKHQKELISAGNLSAHYGTLHHVFEAPSLGAIHGLRPQDSVALDDNPDYNLIPRTWKPGRNMIFLAYAGALAHETGSHIVTIGAHQEDYPGYPDCREQFLMYMGRAMEDAIAMPIAIWAPLLRMTKYEIIKTGLRLDVPFKYTWSCYAGREKACGECDACKRRLHAFEQNEAIDPIEYEDPPMHP